jgi:arylsulfatase A-like enzyme
MGCGSSPKIGQFPLERVQADREWRTAWRVPAGETALDAGSLPGNAVLRVGVLDQGTPEGRVTAEVWVGEERAGVLESAGRKEWRDFRLPLEGKENETCRVVFRSSEAFFVGPLEVIAAAPVRNNVLIFLIDTLRLDHLHCYGYDKETSPNIDRFAEESVKFTRLTPQSSWTRPSVASLLTSTYPNVHGAQDRDDIMRTNLPTLAGHLSRHGYETHMLVANANVLPEWGIGHEFFRYVDLSRHDLGNTRDQRVVDAAIETAGNAAGRPWFLYLHTIAPHEPYDPPESFRRFSADTYAEWNEQRYPRRREALARYDGEILSVDHQFGRLMDALKALDLYDNTLIVVVSDHGEEFWEHRGTGHGRTLFEEQLRIPLLLKLPGGRHAGEVRENLVEMIDLAPTFVELLGLPGEHRFQGRSLVEVLEGTASERDRPAFASLLLDRFNLSAAKTERAKYLWNIKSDKEYWYNLVLDPSEMQSKSDPVPGGENLDAYVRMMGGTGTGLHLLVTGAHDSNLVVSGVVQAAGMGGYELVHPRQGIKANRLNDAVGFSINLNQVAATPPISAASPRSPSCRKHVPLRIDLPRDQPFRIGVFVDGRAIDAEAVFAGADRRHVALGDVDLDPADFQAPPDAFLVRTLPDRFAVYLWYVDDVNKITVQQMDDEMFEALQGMGYL